MAIAIAILIEIATVLFAGALIFAGGMRTTGATDDDSRNALVVFICGSLFAAVVGVSHWIGW